MKDCDRKTVYQSESSRQIVECGSATPAHSSYWRVASGILRKSDLQLPRMTSVRRSGLMATEHFNLLCQMESSFNRMGRKTRIEYLRKAPENEWACLARFANFRVGELATILGLNVRYVERLTRSKFGSSPREFLLRQRMNAARDLMRSADSIKEVSFQLGYTHPTIFNRHFKQFYGLTPTEFLTSHSV